LFGEPMPPERARDLIQAQARDAKSARQAVPAVASK
jgi:hypothetical protein